MILIFPIIFLFESNGGKYFWKTFLYTGTIFTALNYFVIVLNIWEQTLYFLVAEVPVALIRWGWTARGGVRRSLSTLSKDIILPADNQLWRVVALALMCADCWTE